MTNPSLLDQNPADLFSETIFEKNPLTYELPPDSIKEIYLNNIETSNRFDSIFYFMQLLDMSNKKDSNLMISKVRDWPGLTPLHSLGLLNVSNPCTFIQMFVLDRLSNNFHDEYICSLIPVFVGFLMYPTCVISPVSEYLVELALRCPMNVALG